MSEEKRPSATVDYLPVWKKDATPGERLRELALIADKHPERFKKWVIVYVEECPPDNDHGGGPFCVRWMMGQGMRITDMLGTLTSGIQEIWRETLR